MVCDKQSLTCFLQKTRWCAKHFDKNKRNTPKSSATTWNNVDDKLTAASGNKNDNLFDLQNVVTNNVIVWLKNEKDPM